MKQKVASYKQRISKARRFDELVQLDKNLSRSKIDDSNINDLRYMIMEAALPHWWRIMKIRYHHYHNKPLNLDNRIEMSSYISYKGSDLEAWAIQEIYKPTKSENRLIAAKFLKEYVPNRYEDLPGYGIKWFHGSPDRGHGIKRDIYYSIVVKDRVMKRGKLKKCKVFAHRDYDRSPRVIIYDPATGYYSD